MMIICENYLWYLHIYAPDNYVIGDLHIGQILANVQIMYDISYIYAYNA